MYSLISPQAEIVFTANIVAFLQKQQPSYFVQMKYIAANLIWKGK